MITNYPESPFSLGSLRFLGANPPEADPVPEAPEAAPAEADAAPPATP